MNLDEMNQLLDELAPINPLEKRKEALSKLVRINDEEIPILIQDTGKSYWQEAVTVINEIGCPRNYIAIPRLIWLLQDLNWPGTQGALKLMERIDKSVLIPYIEEALKEASCDEDYEWIAGIKELVTRKALTEIDFTNKRVYQILNLSAW